MSSISLEGKVSIITGGAGGIGRGVAEAFASLGAHVIVADTNTKSLLDLEENFASHGWSLEAIECDVRITENVRALMAGAESGHGRLDILVNNVGHTLRLLKPLEEMTDEDLDGLFQILLKHVMVCSREAIPLLKRSGEGGSIISISSIEGYRGLPNIVPYGAFKLAIEGFTKSLALELGPAGIRVNAIAPETTESESIKPSKWLSEEKKARIPQWIPLGRFGKPSDVAGCATFLATPLSEWVTGTTIHCDGGSLAAAGWYRTGDGTWTNTPLIEGSGF
jgi:NAD(P)-dependent dehydrogenase (short-subunit alcohol dehydrogenase family)